MSKIKTHFFKRLMAFILVFLTLSSALSIISYAGDTVFLETLINTDKYTYVANFTSDTKARLRKYAYKYVNLAYLLGKGCGTAGGGYNPNTPGNQKNPNFCFQLKTNHEYGKTEYRKYTWGDDLGTLANDKAAVNVFFLLEGYTTGANFINDDANRGYALSGKVTKIMNKATNKYSMPLSYPGYYTETVTDEQAEYGQETLISLVSSLNGILREVNDGQKFTGVTEMVNKSIMIRPDDDTNIVFIEPKDTGYHGYMIVYADLTNITGNTIKYETSSGQATRALANYSGSDPLVSTYFNINTNKLTGASGSSLLNSLGLPRADLDKGLYAYVFPVGKNLAGSYVLKVSEASMFVYAIPKGFTDIKYCSLSCPADCTSHVFYKAKFLDGGKTYNYVKDDSQPGDTPWISIHMLSFYANTVYKQNNISVSSYVAPDSNVITKIIGAIFQGILWAIRGILGLTAIDVLVFNLGARGSSAYNYGLMSESWWHVVLQYQLIFQAIAWVILACGFIKTLISLNLSTMSGNPQKRATLYDTIQKFIVVGVGLVILIPGVQFLLECNDVIVELFASQITTSSLNMPLVNNIFVQFLVGMLWITITLYINFIYIMRSITVALLIASGPFFISTIAFGSSKALFSSWFKELLSNIFMQAMHAFVLSFLVQLLSQGTFLETFAIAISIIPITEMFRNLIFAGGGGSTTNAAHKATGAMNTLGHSIGSGVTNGVGGVIGAVTGGGSGGGNGGGSGGSGGGGGKGNALSGAMSNMMKDKANKMGNGTSAGAKIKKASEQKTGKAGGRLDAKILGTAVDGLGMAGMAMAAALPDMMDMVKGAGDLALNGDASAMGAAISNRISTGMSNTAGVVASGVQGHIDKKNQESASGTGANTSSTADMGGAAIDTKTGTTAATTEGAPGGAINAGKVTGSTKVSSMNTTNLSTGQKGLTVDPKKKDSDMHVRAKQAKALQDYRAAEKDPARQASAVDSVVKDDKGNDVHGTTYSWTDAAGNRQSFFMDRATHGALMNDRGVGSLKEVSGSNQADIDRKIDGALDKHVQKASNDYGVDYTNYKDVGSDTSYQASVSDLSETSVGNRKAALLAANGPGQEVTFKDKNGKNMAGQQFSYTDDKGRERSFVMSHQAISEAKASKEAANAKPVMNSTENGWRRTATVGGEYIKTVGTHKEAVQDMSGASVGDRNAAMAMTKDPGTAVKYQDSKGNTVSGRQFNYQDANGNVKSFVMSDQAIQEAREHGDDVTQNFNMPHMNGNNQAMVSVGNTSELAAAGMATMHGSFEGDYYNANGEKAGSVFKYNGQRMAVSNEDQVNASRYIQQYAEAQIGSKEGLAMTQKVDSYQAYLNKQYNGQTDFSNESGTQAIADAAMISLMGRDLDNGQYQLGQHVYNTGMSQDQARNILQARGITGVQRKDDDTMSYVQRNSPTHSNTLSNTNHGPNGHAIGRFAMNIGKAGGPKSFAADGNGGGKMTFDSRAAAARYFNSTGNMDMARAVGGVNDGGTERYGAITLRDNGDKGFSVDFNGKALKEQGTRMELAKNGHDMLVSSNDASIKDVFSLQNQEHQLGNDSSGNMTASTVGDRADQAFGSRNTNTN